MKSKKRVLLTKMGKGEEMTNKFWYNVASSLFPRSEGGSDEGRPGR